jgi:hypothetical protein
MRRHILDGVSSRAIFVDWCCMMRSKRITRAPNQLTRCSRDRVSGRVHATRLGLSIHMYDLDCPICMNSFKFEDIRSLPCGESRGRTVVGLRAFTLRYFCAGHTYCFSCVEKLIDEFPTCPECRQEFDFEDVRRLFVKPSASNNSSGSQLASTGCDPRAEEGFVKQAKHIARRLRKINANSSAQSVKIAADVIEDVATVQCKEAQARSARVLRLTLLTFL